MHRKRPLILLAIIVFILAIFVIKTASFYPFLFQLIFNRGVNLKQTSDNRINILLLGIGGGSHEGPNLTDTIILASFDQKNNKVTLVSIPRDLWFPDINQKINAAYQIGLSSKNPDAGLALAKAAVGKATGQSIDYAVRLDFSGFVKTVDEVQGLDINVDDTFDDYQYPVDGEENANCGHTPVELQAMASDSADQAVIDFPCRYKHLHFDKGLQHMDGEMTLEFVRSRHGTNGENSDFARSKRQEKVINAFKAKILSAQTLLNLPKVLSIYNTLKSSIDMNIPQSEFDDFIRLAEKMRGAKIQSVVIDTGDESSQRAGLLNESVIQADYGDTSALIPRIGNGNFSEIQKYISCEITKGNCVVSPLPAAASKN
jgi:LCP family protein required for cell wall assembly